MQQGFQELSKEEKEEMVQRRMDDMRRKNEELLKRYAEIEADKKNADLFSSSAIKDSPKKLVPVHEVHGTLEHQRIHGPAERQGVLRPLEQPKPLRRPHTKPPQNKVQPEDRRTQRLSADDHPPPDPGFRFLADRMREQGEDEGANEHHPEDWGEPRGRSQRHRRNYGGSDFENVGPTMRHERDLEREHPESPPRNLAMRMTGRQRREYEQWKCDRERIDQERLLRHTTSSGEFKREWDHHKEDQEDLPPQPGRKYEDQSHSYGSRVFSRGGRRGRGDGLSRGPRRGGRQETARDRTESSSSARSDLSSESEYFRDRPRSHRQASREHVANLPRPNVDTAGNPHHGNEQLTVLRNYDQSGEEVHRHTTGDYEQSNYDQRNYNRGSEQRNYNPSCDGRNHDRNTDFDRRGRGSREQRPRERRGRDWGGRGGRDKMVGGRGSQPWRRAGERRGGERSFADRREGVMRISSSATDSDDAVFLTEPRTNTSVEQKDARGERRSGGGKIKFAEKREDTARLSATAEDVRRNDACYEEWDASGQGAGGVEWGVEEDDGKGDEREEEDVKGGDDEGWEDAPSPPRNDDDNAEEMDEDEAFERSAEGLLEQSDETELMTDVRDSVQTVRHEEVGPEDDDRETGESSKEGSKEKVVEEHTGDEDSAKGHVVDAVIVDDVEREENDFDNGDGSSRDEEDGGPTGNSSAAAVDADDELESTVKHTKDEVSSRAAEKEDDVFETFPADKVQGVTPLTERYVSDSATLKVVNDETISTEPREEARKAQEVEDVNQIDHKNSQQNGTDSKPQSLQTSSCSSTVADKSLNGDTASKDSADRIALEEKEVVLESTCEDKRQSLQTTAVSTE